MELALTLLLVMEFKVVSDDEDDSRVSSRSSGDGIEVPLVLLEEENDDDEGASLVLRVVVVLRVARD